MKKVFNEILRIENRGEFVKTYSPFSNVYNEGARKLGGVFIAEGTGGYWRFPAGAYPYVHGLMIQVYGTVGGPEPVEVCTVRITTSSVWQGHRSGIEFLGRQLARAFGRDSKAYVGDNVSFIQRGPASGGSVKNWLTIIPEGSVIAIYDIPTDFAWAVSGNKESWPSEIESMALVGDDGNDLPEFPKEEQEAEPVTYILVNSWDDGEKGGTWHETFTDKATAEESFCSYRESEEAEGTRRYYRFHLALYEGRLLSEAK